MTKKKATKFACTSEMNCHEKTLVIRINCDTAMQTVMMAQWLDAAIVKICTDNYDELVPQPVPSRGIHEPYMSMRSPIVSARNKDIFIRFVAGEKSIDIANDHDLSTQSIHRVTRRVGRRLQNQGCPAYSTENIYTMRKNKERLLEKLESFEVVGEKVIG